MQPMQTAARPATPAQERYIAALWRELEATGYAHDAEAFLDGAGVPLLMRGCLIAVQSARLSSTAAGTLISALLRLRAVADAADRAA